MEEKIASLVRSNRDRIIEDWNNRIILNLRTVAELMGIEECREITGILVDRLLAIMAQKDSVGDAGGPGIEDLSRRLVAHRLTPSEGARLVFSLKEVLFAHIREEFSHEESLSGMMMAGHQIDNMAVVTLKIYMDAKEAVIADQQKAFQEVSVPVVKIWDRIIMIPLVGMLDSERTQLMMEVLLTSLEDLQAQVTILDISGIPVVDTLVARHLITAASAVRLMGAECIITGIRARIAQTLVELGVDLSGFMTRTTLADGLSAALQITGQSIK